MLKRLIEVALPLKEVSEQSAREKSIRHGHISTLHIWWARRPLAACRAAVFASLIPDPDDPECPEDFRKLVVDLLKKEIFRPSIEGNGVLVEDTPRNRCLEFIKHLVKWENSNDPDFTEPARKLIASAHKFLNPDGDGIAPKVLDPFSGGGAIPLEAMRLGCDAYANDLNPVAHLIELCTLVYPQKYGQPNVRSVPDYIKRLIAHNRATKNAKDRETLFKDDNEPVTLAVDEVIPEMEITEAEYRKNPLAADVKYWGHWILARVATRIGRFYPEGANGDVPVAYLWARTVKCPNPRCGGTVPLLLHRWLCRKPGHDVALTVHPDRTGKGCRFGIATNSEIDFDADLGTMKRGRVECPLCQQVAPAAYLKQESNAGRMGEQMTAVLSVTAGKSGKVYRSASENDAKVFASAADALRSMLANSGIDSIPTESISLGEPRRLSPPLYGLHKFADLFNARQSLALASFGDCVREVVAILQQQDDSDYAQAVGSYLALCQSRLADFTSSLCVLNNVGGRGVKNTFARQALPMVWDYAESSPFNEQGANWQACVDAAVGVISRLRMRESAVVTRGSASSIPVADKSLAAVLTDPPYYDAVPYSDLSDFFYVWLKRTASSFYPDAFRTPLTPKQQEIVEQRPHRTLTKRKDSEFYERMMARVFDEIHRVMSDSGICAVMFAHKTTAAWETLISGLIRAGLAVTASWPLRTEKPGRATSQGTAALASSVTLICRKRKVGGTSGFWDDVRKELRKVAKERLEFFWLQNIRGADFFISAIGPALSVFGRYDEVTKLDGQPITVGQFLDEVRALVTNFALTKILKTTHTGSIDAESRFYVVWKWSYGDAKVPADESFKLAQALGMTTEIMWDRTGVLEKSGENVQCVPVAKRMRIKDLGEPNPDGTPGSLIDVLHRMCVFREKNDTDGMAEFLGHSGQGGNPSLWLVAQAVSEILPDGEKEKQLMQGLLNQKENLEQAGGRLF